MVWNEEQEAGGERGGGGAGDDGDEEITTLRKRRRSFSHPEQKNRHWALKPRRTRIQAFTFVLRGGAWVGVRGRVWLRLLLLLFLLVSLCAAAEGAGRDQTFTPDVTAVRVWYLPRETDLRQMELLLLLVVVVLGDTESALFGCLASKRKPMTVKFSTSKWNTGGEPTSAGFQLLSQHLTDLIHPGGLDLRCWGLEGTRRSSESKRFFCTFTDTRNKNDSAPGRWKPPLWNCTKFQTFCCPPLRSPWFPPRSSGKKKKHGKHL